MGRQAGKVKNKFNRNLSTPLLLLLLVWYAEHSIDWLLFPSGLMQHCREWADPPRAPNIPVFRNYRPGETLIGSLGEIRSWHTAKSDAASDQDRSTNKTSITKHCRVIGHDTDYNSLSLRCLVSYFFYFISMCVFYIDTPKGCKIFQKVLSSYTH